VKEVVAEPMFILLSIACALYFVLGQVDEGLLMAAAMILVAAISLYQELRSSNAMRALRQYTAERVPVIRSGVQQSVPTSEIVPGDIVVLEEGMLVPADARIIQSNDLAVNESIITGEAMPVDKQANGEASRLYQGTLINRGTCLATVTETGSRTVLGKLGREISAISSPKTLLQLQMRKVVRRLALFGISGFLVILLIQYSKTQEWSTSLLLALTLAMSAVPEEIPVALSSFMALGAYKMSRFGIISRQPQIIENLGAVSVICLDKTGTITQNRMAVKELYDAVNNRHLDLTSENRDGAVEHLLYIAALASETRPFDPMEQAIWEAFEELSKNTTERPTIEHEYPLQGRPPMMTHIYSRQDGWQVAGKGAAERIMQVCGLEPARREEMNRILEQMGAKGYRVLGVAEARHQGSFPENQDDFDWQFLGLLALYDPPKENIAEVIGQFYTANIEVKLLTGDHPQTARYIAGMAGIRAASSSINGSELMHLDDVQLREVLKRYNVFARMFPDAKKKVIECLQNDGEIVAMTGDGVNDGPALKAAGIGIAMGKKGTEIARRAADLVITDDDLGKMVTAVREGRRIFSNLKKAIRYIISIHIPIILVASLPLILGWTYPTIFTPIHVIFLELIMGPTCSIFFEREPAEEGSMRMLPRKRTGGLFTSEEWWLSVVQGLVIAFAALFLYFFYMREGAPLEEVRTIVFSMLLISNFFLTFSNRSTTETIVRTIRYPNNLAPLVWIISIIVLLILHFVVPVRDIFQLASISSTQFIFCLAMGMVSVLWVEIYKAGIKRL
jgi:Ca2+-transporting ATPase